MADQRQPFRFRLPWLSAPIAPPPPPRPSIESQPFRPTAETQMPAQPATAVPIQRPPFRPAGIAPAQPPPSQAQVPQRTEPMPAQPATDVPIQRPPFRPAGISPAQPPSSQAQVPQRTEPTPAQPATDVPIQRPPFRPAGIAPAQPPPSQAQVPQRTEPQPPSKFRASTEPQVTSQPASPSRSAPQTRSVASLPPSPSRATPQSRAVGPIPSSPSRTSQTQPASGTTPQPQSSSRLPSQPTGLTTSLQPTGTAKLQPTIQESSKPTPTTTQPPSSLSEKGPKPVMSHPLSQESQPKTQVSSETISNSQNHTQIETSSQLNGVASRPTKFSPTSPPQKSDSNAIGGDAKPKSEEREGGKKVVRAIIEEEKTSGPGYEEPTKRTITELLTAATSIQAKQKPKQEKEETFDRKEAIFATSSSAKQINTTSSMHPNDRKSTSSISTTQKPSVVSNGERLPLHEEVRKDIFKYVQKLATGHPIDEKPVSVITLAGENKGASMHLGLESAKKEGTVHIHRGYKLNPDESTEATTDGEGISKAKRSKDPTTKENPPSKAYANSNVQSVNNSILFNSFVTERNPGVQLVVSNNQEEPIKSNGKPEPLQTRKAEFNITPAEKLTKP